MPDKTIEDLQKENLSLQASVMSLTGERDALKGDLDKVKKELSDARELNASLYLRVSSEDVKSKEDKEEKKTPSMLEAVGEYLNTSKK